MVIFLPSSSCKLIIVLVQQVLIVKVDAIVVDLLHTWNNLNRATILILRNMHALD